MLAVLGALAAFIAVSSIVMVLTTPSGGAAERRLARLNKPVRDPQRAIGNVLYQDKGTFFFLRSLVRGEWAERTRARLAQAGLTLRVSEYLIIRVLAGAAVAALIVIATSGSGVGLLIGAMAGLIGTYIPVMTVAILRSRRQEKLEKQLPEALTLISGSLRSGFAFTQAVELAAKQIDAPIKEELDLVIRDTALGASADSALEQLSVRTGSKDIELMVASVLVQRTTGGNLSEILDNVADTVRERERLQSDIKAITSSQRLTGLVLSVYPIALWLGLTAISPTIYKVLFTEPEGRVMLLIAAVLQVCGFITIRRLLRLEV